MRVISLFSGIGGSSEGYIAAGADVLASVEFLDYQARVYRANHPETRVYEEDIRKPDPLEIISYLGLKVGELDVLDGSPPCSSFSVSGKGSKGWGKAKSYGNRKQVTDDLFFEYIRFVEAIKPKFFVAEKVYPDSANAFRILEGGSNDHKLAHTTPEEVIKKERDIRDIMRPFEEELLVSELESRFRSVTTIWACFNFRAYMCIK